MSFLIEIEGSSIGMPGLPIYVKPETFVSEIEEEISRILWIHPKAQLLKFKKQKMNSISQIKDYGIGENDTINLVRKEIPSGSFYVFIRGTNGEMQTYLCHPSDEIWELKMQFREKNAIASNIMLIYNGRSLANERLIQDYSIKPRDILFVVLALRGD